MSDQTVPAPHRPQQAPPAGLTPIPIGKLLSWARQHPSRTVVRKAERVHALLAELRAYHAADEEIAQAAAEEERLLQQLAAVRARKEQLRPKRKSPVRDYDQAEVRAWARAHGHNVSEIGTVPNTVVAAWREATGGAQ